MGTLFRKGSFQYNHPPQDQALVFYQYPPAVPLPSESEYQRFPADVYKRKIRLFLAASDQEKSDQNHRLVRGPVLLCRPVRFPLQNVRFPDSPFRLRQSRHHLFFSDYCTMPEAGMYKL